MSRITILLVAVLGLSFSLGQSEPPPPNAHDWHYVLERIAHARAVVLISVAGMDDELTDTLAAVSSSGVHVYLLCDDQAKQRELSHYGVKTLGNFVGPIIVVDDTVYVYLDDYGSYIETKSPVMAKMYLHRFGVEEDVQ